jgi:flagellar M-ring protein FliF
VASTIDPGAILSQLLSSYMKLPLVQKIAFPVLIFGAVAGVILVSKWANHPEYAVLFSDLEAADASAVVERLKSQKIAYELRGDGGTIAVAPPEMVHELRITLASEGVPKGGKVGFEIFDSTSIGTTTFVEKLKFMRALQGELERTISSLEAVSSARVHITMPEKTVFAKSGSEPTASVMLRLRAGGQLEKQQAVGIMNLVAGSVEGLKRENVTIIDVYGNILSPREDNEESEGIDANRLQYQREIEKGFVQRVEQMLNKILGPGKAIARVTADMDFTQSEREEESFDPGGQVLRSEKTSEEGAGESQRGGVTGVASNLSNDPALITPQTAQKDAAQRREAVKNYEVSRAVTKLSSPRGKLVRLSVAVLVDGTYEAAQPSASGGAAAAAAAPAKVFKALEPDVMRRLESLVKSAVGYDSARGDTLTVENIQFFVPDSDMAEAMDQKASQDMIFNIISKGIPILFILLFFFVVVRPLVKFLITPTEAEVDLTRLLPTGIDDLENELEQERSKATIPTMEPTVDLEQLEELMAENSRVVKDNPGQAALLIRYWLNDGRL